MSCFAVIDVDQSYDYVEGLRCLATFLTEQEANDHFQMLTDQANAANLAKMQYIEKFVDAIELPEGVDYLGWLEFLKQYHPFGQSYTYPKNFKNELKSYLMHYTFEFKGYDPPSIYRHWTNIFVIEICDPKEKQ